VLDFSRGVFYGAIKMVPRLWILLIGCYHLVQAQTTPTNVIGSCSVKQCDNDGQCVKILGQERCVCVAGWSGTLCEIAPTVQAMTTVQACDFNPCFNGGVCSSDPVDDYVCTCPAAYTGVVCELLATTTTAPVTTTTAAPTTTDDHQCSFNPCKNGGVCVKWTDSYTCACPSQWTGPVCTQKVTNAPPSTPPTTTTAATVPTTTTNPTTTRKPETLLETLGKEGCHKAEVVFSVEHLRGDSETDVDHEALFIMNMANGWKIDNSHVRVGVLAYDKEVKEHIHLDDYSGDRKGLNDKLENLASQVGDYGNADVVQAMDWTRSKMYKDHKSGAQKVAVVMVHQMSPSARQHFADAARRLHNDGIKLYAIGVHISKTDSDVLKANSDHYFEFATWNDMHHNIPEHHGINCT